MFPHHFLHRRAGGHLGNVEDLVDEMQQPLLAAHDGGGIAVDFAIGRGEAHHLAGGGVDNGEGRAKLVGDVGEEIGAHLLRFFHNLLPAGAHSAGIEQEADGGAGEEETDDEADERDSADGFLFFVVEPHEFHLALLAAALVADTHVLHVADVFLALHAVGILPALYETGEGGAAVAPTVVEEIFEAIGFGEMLERRHSLGGVPGAVEIDGGAGQIAFLHIHACQGETGFEPVPGVALLRHEVVGAAIRRGCAVEAVLFFVEPPEVGVAERDAEWGVRLAVELHGAGVIIFCGVEPAVCLEKRANIGAVDGLSECAAQGALAGESEAEHGVGGLAVIERKVHVADAVE